MKINTEILTIKIDKETKSYIEYLRKNSINPSHIIREAIRQPLKHKCIEFKIKLFKPKLPF